MADTLRRLTSTSSFNLLQDKLDSWHRDYHIVSCEQNLNRCCELIEITAKIQSQLFTILNLAAAEGGQYAGVDTLKTRLLPWLGTCFSVSRPSVTDDTSLQLIQDSVEKDRRIRELSVHHDSDQQKLSSTRLQLDSTRAELVDAQMELDATKSKSATTLLATEDEILQLKADLRSAHEQLDVYRRKLEAADDQERQIRLLRDEVSYLSTGKALLQDKLTRSRSPTPPPRLSRSSTPPPRLPRSPSPRQKSESPTRAQLTSSSRRARLVSRYSDLHAVERLEAQTLLRRHVEDLEMAQKIIFIAVEESFKTSKLAYRHFKLRVKKTLCPTRFGLEGVEDSAVDYIVRNMDLHDIQTTVNDVINAMNVNPRISFPPEVDFVLISTLIRETCRVAFALQTLDPPPDLAFASDGELFDDRKYRRSYNSELSAPLVMYHVWPALMEGDAVLVKGEAVTRRGAVWSRSRSSPVRSRSLSPARSLVLNSRRSLSPDRLTASRL
ncbi:mitochondria-eating protein isoform X2 [Clinocottus analis]|uniref:mitochondria-eating protein isoform X2 n=1 Tax=Clinocottus analis TaxID=304258 RepID=UPI0035BF9EAE